MDDQDNVVLYMDFSMLLPSYTNNCSSDDLTHCLLLCNTMLKIYGKSHEGLMDA